MPRVDEKDRSRRATRGVVPEREGAGYLLGGDGGAREARAKRNARVRSARGRRRGSRKRRARGISHTWHKTNHSGVEAGPGELELDDLTAPIPRERRATTRAARRPTRTPRIIAIRSLRRALAVSLHAQRGGGGFDASGLLRRAVRALTDGAEAFGGGESDEENDRASSSFDMSLVSHETPPPPPEGYSVVTEGKARILQRANEAFYNKAQVVNRDLSLAVIRQFQRARATEHETEKRTPKNRRMKGLMCATPRDSAILPYLLTADEIEDMYKSQLEHERDDAEKAAKEGGGGGGGGDGGTAGGGGEKREGEEDADAPPKQKPPLKPIRVLEGMAASGLRAVRYARELEDLGCVVANDLDPRAIASIARNVEYNAKCSEDAATRMKRIVCASGDVRMLMMQHEKMFDVVDLDPYGTPSTLLDGAVQTAADGALLCVTATDMAVLCGNNGEVCWTKYGAYPHRAKYCHEQAVRILLASIDAAASRYKRHIVPMISVSIDFYVRVFVRIYTSAKECKMAASKVSYVYQCVGCDTFALQPVGKSVTKGESTKFQPGSGPSVPEKCPNCGWHWNVGGPFWSEPTHDMGFVADVKKHVEGNKDMYPGYDKIHGLLTTVEEELPDVPLHYDIHSMSMCLKATPPPMPLLRSAVINAGYRVSSAHSNPLAIKTDAPAEVLWDILRCWIKEHPVKAQPTKTPGCVILSKEPTTAAKWTRVAGAFTKAQREKVTRFPRNPEENWGPKQRAGRPEEGRVGRQGHKKRRTG